MSVEARRLILYDFFQRLREELGLELDMEPSDASTLPLPTTGKKQEAPSPKLTDLFLRFREVAEGLPDVGSRAAQKLLDNTFIFSDKHLPVSDRRLQQHWRHLGAYAEARPGTEIDLPATVNIFAEKGFLVAPAYLPVKTFRQHTLFLIDDSGSMAAFTSLADRLVETIRESLQSARTSVYYFHNFPGGQLFKHRYHYRPVERGDFIREVLQDASLQIIISDAGAARGTVHDDRIMQTKDFLTNIRQKIPHVLWLNPMPRNRWINSSAMYLSLYVSMVEAGREGLRQLPQILRHF